jgi:hypothetical protein
MDTLAKRTKVLKGFGFRCDCMLCESQRQLTRNQQAALVSLESEFNESLISKVHLADRKCIPELVKLIERMDAAYPPNFTLKIEMLELLGGLVLVYVKNNMAPQAIDQYKRIICIMNLGKCPLAHGVHSPWPGVLHFQLANISDSFSMLGDYANSQEYDQVDKVVSRIIAPL